MCTLKSSSVPLPLPINNIVHVYKHMPQNTMRTINFEHTRGWPHVHECVTIHKQPRRAYVSTHSIMLHIKMFTSVSIPVSRVHRHVHTCHHTCILPYTQKHVIAEPCRHMHTTITTLLKRTATKHKHACATVHKQRHCDPVSIRIQTLYHVIHNMHPINFEHARGCTHIHTHIIFYRVYRVYQYYVYIKRACTLNFKHTNALHHTQPNVMR